MSSRHGPAEVPVCPCLSLQVTTHTDSLSHTGLLTGTLVLGIEASRVPQDSKGPSSHRVTLRVPGVRTWSSVRDRPGSVRAGLWSREPPLGLGPVPSPFLLPHIPSHVSRTVSAVSLTPSPLRASWGSLVSFTAQGTQMWPGSRLPLSSLAETPQSPTALDTQDGPAAAPTPSPSASPHSPDFHADLQLLGRLLPSSGLAQAVSSFLLPSWPLSPCPLPGVPPTQQGHR